MVCLSVQLNVFICNLERWLWKKNCSTSCTCSGKRRATVKCSIVRRALCVVCISREDFITPFDTHMHCYGNKRELTPAPFISFSHYVSNYSDYELARGKNGNVALFRMCKTEWNYLSKCWWEKESERVLCSCGSAVNVGTGDVCSLPIAQNNKKSLLIPSLTHCTWVTVWHSKNSRISSTGIWSTPINFFMWHFQGLSYSQQHRYDHKVK